MPNLNLTHSGNMNITSASLGSGGTLNVKYAPNDTGAITGWTITPESGREDWSSGETITIRYVPQFSGTVLTETFTVSGVDEAGVERSDSSVLRQTYNTDLRLYFNNVSPAGIFTLYGVILNSSAMTSNYIEANVTLTGDIYSNYVQALILGSSWPTRAPAIWTGYLDTTPPETGTVASSLTLTVDGLISGSSQASAAYSPSSAYVNLVYSSSDTSKATIDSRTGEITALDEGAVTFCVTDTISGLQDCKTVSIVTGGTNHYFSIYVTGEGNLQWSTNSSYVENCQYRKNYGEWIGSEMFTLEVEPGDLFEFKCDYKVKTGQGIGSNNFTGTTCEFITFGNIMSLAYGDNYLNQNTLVNEDQFKILFYGCTGLTNAENLCLPATALTRSCYGQMFEGCTSLVNAPELPATDLTDKNFCYSYMFADCTSLQEAPELPATALSQSCYSEMFMGCTSLTTAPALPATALDNYCYSKMFMGCTNLATAPALPATTLDTYCYHQMFRGCTSLISAPELPATALTSSCYDGMFRECTSLRFVKSLAGTNLMNWFGLDNWLAGVSPTGLFIKNPAAGISDTSSTNVYERGASGIPENWVVENDT